MQRSDTERNSSKENVTSNLSPTKLFQKRLGLWSQRSNGSAFDDGTTGSAYRQLLPGIIRLCKRLSPRVNTRSNALTEGDGAVPAIKQQPLAALTTLEPLPPIERFVPERLPYIRPEPLAADQAGRRGSFEEYTARDGTPMWLHTPTARRLCTGKHPIISMTCIIARTYPHRCDSACAANHHACLLAQLPTSSPAR